MKHAGGSAVQLAVQTDGKHFKLAVADDGQGFDVGTMTANGHRNGLENMKRRADAVGGRLNVTSEAGRGTRVEFAVDFTG